MLLAAGALAGSLVVWCAPAALAPAPGDPTKAHPAQPPDDPAGAPPPPAPENGKKPGGKSKNADSATSNAPDQPAWDPLRAEKDMQVGHYYMKKGDVDAAIDRFEDAIVAKPGYDIPYLY